LTNRIQLTSDGLKLYVKAVDIHPRIIKGT
jgi:hypothetical protein